MRFREILLETAKRAVRDAKIVKCEICGKRAIKRCYAPTTRRPYAVVEFVHTYTTDGFLLITGNICVKTNKLP